MQIYYFQIGSAGAITIKNGDEDACQQFLTELQSEAKDEVKLIGTHSGDEALLTKIKDLFSEYHTGNGYYLPNEKLLDFINNTEVTKKVPKNTCKVATVAIELKLGLRKELQEQSLPEALKEYERNSIIEALKLSNGVQKIAAELLGISGSSLNQRMNRLRVSNNSPKYNQEIESDTPVGYGKNKVIINPTITVQHIK